eukprot:261956_1
MSVVVSSRNLVTSIDNRVVISNPLENILSVISADSDKTLTHLSVSNIRFWDVILIGQALRNNSTVISLSIRDSTLERTACESLAGALRENKSLTLLELTHCRIGCEVKVLANAIEENSTLTDLRLSDNNIGEEGILSIAEMVSVNRTLQSLEVSRNSFSHIGASHLAMALSGKNIHSDCGRSSKSDQVKRQPNLPRIQFLGMRSSKALAKFFPLGPVALCIARSNPCILVIDVECNESQKRELLHILDSHKRDHTHAIMHACEIAGLVLPFDVADIIVYGFLV